jgi:hypothetical protein
MCVLLLCARRSRCYSDQRMNAKNQFKHPPQAPHSNKRHLLFGERRPDQRQPHQQLPGGGACALGAPRLGLRLRLRVCVL